jgi:hypothetical protein
MKKNGSRKHSDWIEIKVLTPTRSISLRARPEASTPFFQNETIAVLNEAQEALQYIRQLFQDGVLRQKKAAKLHAGGQQAKCQTKPRLNPLNGGNGARPVAPQDHRNRVSILAYNESMPKS